jgi:hypothetical protein
MNTDRDHAGLGLDCDLCAGPCTIDSDPPPVCVVGVDPGPTPGVCVLGTGYHADAVPAVFQCNAPSVGWLVQTMLALRGDLRAVLAIERFIVGMRSARSAHAGAGELTRSMIGELTTLGHLAGAQVVFRPAADVMPWATDKRLKAAGLLEPTKALPHARAAARHALYAAVRDGGLPDPLSTKAGAR